ncbi:hypothetical protein XENTR_v10022733 [Xenopus tropicalis]|nr:hypothetical protein XENTR_v10022733 [Xenopus tropicalis]
MLLGPVWSETHNASRGQCNMAFWWQRRDPRTPWGQLGNFTLAPGQLSFFFLFGLDYKWQECFSAGWIFSRFIKIFFFNCPHFLSLNFRFVKKK